MATQSKVAQNPLLVWYRLRLQARPLQTKMFTAATFMALGEILAGNFSGMTAAQAQLLGARARKGVDSASDLMVDVRHWLISHGLNGRAGKMFLYGLLINAPMGHYLTAQLQRAFAGHTSFRAKIAQIVTANLTVSVLANVVNLVCMAYINGARSVQGVVLAVKTNFWKVMRIAWTTNPISIAIAQSYLPLELWGTKHFLQGREEGNLHEGLLIICLSFLLCLRTFLHLCTLCRRCLD